MNEGIERTDVVGSRGEADSPSAEREPIPRATEHAETPGEPAKAADTEPATDAKPAEAPPEVNAEAQAAEDSSGTNAAPAEAKPGEAPPEANADAKPAEVPPDAKSEAKPADATPEAKADAKPAEAKSTDDAKKATDAAASRKPNPQAAYLYRAFRSHRPVSGKVEKVIKGGYEIRVGHARGFCPHSQIDLNRVEDPESFVGQRFQFRVTQVRRGGADVVLSRRAVIEEEKKEEAKAVRTSLLQGSVVRGRVAGLADFGAFVDLGASVMGLVHVSEIGHGRIRRVQDVVKVGDMVTVKILAIDDDRNRISLSVRQAVDDPWEKVAETYEVGKRYNGEIQRVTDFGCFVELQPGVEALAPAGELPPSRLGWRDQLQQGHSREWLVISVDRDARRIAVTIPSEDDQELAEVTEGQTLTGKVQRIERFGVFVWLGPGKVGLMPSALTGTPPGTDLSRRFTIADPIEVDVVEVTAGGSKIRLAAKGVKEKAEAEATRRQQTREKKVEGKQARMRKPQRSTPAQQQPSAAFGTSLADKLRAALDQQKKTS